MSTITVKIDDVAFGGDGVARHEGKVVFVPGVLTGETVEVMITTSSKRFSRALPVRVAEPSADRIESTCPYSLKPSSACSASSYCPGCVYRHVNYETESKIKAKQLKDLLLRIARMEDTPSIGIEPAASPDRYRNKVTLHVGDKGIPGYYSADNSTVIPISDCLLANTEISAEIAKLGEYSIPAGSDVILRHTPTNGVMKWKYKAPARPLLTDSSCLGEMQTPPSSFAQVNPAMSAKMTEYIQKAIRSLECENMIDLYCGTGLFAIAAAAAKVPSVFGVEIDQAAVDCANANAKSIAPGHANFICAKAEEGLKTVENALGSLRDTVLLLDPPRRGLSPKLLSLIGRSEPDHIIYVSCAADKLARDIKGLGSGPYRLASLQIFDLFPRTASFETVALLSRTP